MRQLGQEIIESLGGRKIHPAWSVPGGVRESLPIEARDRFLTRLPEAHAVAGRALDYFKNYLDKHAEETRVFGNFPSLFMGLVTPEGNWENYDGLLRFCDSTGKLVDQCDPVEYEEYLGEAVERDSFLKSRPVNGNKGVPAVLQNAKSRGHTR